MPIALPARTTTLAGSKCSPPSRSIQVAPVARPLASVSMTDPRPGHQTRAERRRLGPVGQVGRRLGALVAARLAGAPLDVWRRPSYGAGATATCAATTTCSCCKASTGLGLGIIAGGRLVQGHRGAAGELGHVKVPAAQGLLCRCGDIGCLEAVAGGWALVERLREGGQQVHHVRDLVAQAVHGNGEARAIVRESGRRVGEALAATVTVLNPRAVVVGGDMVGAFEHVRGGPSRHPVPRHHGAGRT